MRKPIVPPIIIIYELVLGSFELLFAIGILLFGNQLLTFYEKVKDTEFAEGSNYILVSFIEKIVPNLFHHRYYIIILLVGLGITKITSGIGLVYQKEWAKHLLIIFLLALIPPDIFAIVKHVSLFTLLNLTINIVIILTLIRFRPIAYFILLKTYLAKVRLGNS